MAAWATLLAVLPVLAVLGMRLLDRQRKRRLRAREIYQRAAARVFDSTANGRVSADVDLFAASRAEAHHAGLPWLEADGTISWPAPTSEVQP